jgi:hypothetical protein
MEKGSQKRAFSINNHSAGRAGLLVLAIAFFVTYFPENCHATVLGE